MPELMGGGEKGQQLTRNKNKKKKNLIGLNYISRGLLMKLNSSHEENLYYSSFSDGEKIQHRVKTHSTPKRRNFHARGNTGLYKDFMCLPFNLHLFCLLEYKRQGDDFKKWHI